MIDLIGRDIARLPKFSLQAPATGAHIIDFNYMIAGLPKNRAQFMGTLGAASQ